MDGNDGTNGTNGAPGTTSLAGLTDGPGGWGTNGQVLQTNGVDAATWATAGGGGATQLMGTVGTNSSVFSNNALSTSISNFTNNTSTALGSHTVFHSSVCMGDNAYCKRQRSVAIGYNANAEWNSVSIGAYAYSLSHVHGSANNVSIGYQAGPRVAGGTSGNVIIGAHAGVLANGLGIICIGHAAGRSPSNWSWTSGAQEPSGSSPTYSTVAANNTTANQSGWYSISIGQTAHASHSRAICLGDNSISYGASTFNIPSSFTAYVGNSQWSTSDDRLKHNEVAITNGLDVLRQITPKLYQKSRSMYLTDEHGRDIVDEETGEKTPYGADFNGVMDGPAGDKWFWDAGVIAQEMHQVLPRFVHEGDETNPWHVNYNALFTYCLGAVKELDGVVQQQQSTIDALLARVSALEAA